MISLLGTGASSKVYLAEHLKLKTYRAIKCIRKTHPVQSQFLLEASLLINLKHPGIPIIYDIEEDESSVYIIEEFVRGESLKTFLLHQDSISPQYIMQFGIQLCEILEYLHNYKPYPILYQDLKPDHIILYGNQLKIVDFGIASYITSQGNYFQKFGTVGFAAPEQYKSGLITIAADIYGVGVVLELLANKSLKNCSKNLNRIIQKSKAVKAEDRFETTSQMKKVLQQELEHTCRKAKPSGKKYLLPKIAVVGAKHGVGTTHVAISLTSFLNQKNEPCIYLEENSEVISAMVHQNYCQEESDGEFSYEYFTGMPYNGEENEREKRQERVYVKDCKNDIEIALGGDADLVIFVISGRLWEQEAVVEAYEKIKYIENLILLCNYNDKQNAKKYATVLQRNVYCFPLDENPFCVSKEKKKLFTLLLKKEGRKKVSVLSTWKRIKKQ